MIIDYSQYSLWNFCPWAWYERYVNQRQRPWIGQRRDPLCLGTLVHNAMDNFAKTGKPSIDEPTLAECNPTPDTYELAVLLVQGYLKTFPSELWPIERAEQPLKFPLQRATQSDQNFGLLRTNVDGLAKLDGYFYVPEDTTIESGVPGSTLTLARGWWSKEYKTKKHGDRSNWIKEWQTKMQGTFQILALQELLQNYPHSERFTNSATDTVQGVLVCVMEKPPEYVPKRKCEGCKQQYELASFIAKSDGYMCPMCGHIQNLSPYTPKVPKVPSYFRITVTREPWQLERAKEHILRTAVAMERMRSKGMESVLPNWDACVNNKNHRECEYLGPHCYGGTTADVGTGFVEIDATKYMGVTQ